jgi:hypothetical protein
MKIILALLLTSSIYAAKPSQEKVEYFLTLINVEKDWGNLSEKEYIKITRKNKVFKLVEKELKEYFQDVFSWEQIKKIAVTEVQKSFTEEEVNKLIAVYELPVMKKFSAGYRDSITPKLRDFVKSRLKKDDPRFAQIKETLKKRYRESKSKGLKK